MTRQELNNKVTQYGYKKSGRSRRSRILSVLASVVVFCVTYALIIPAITWEKTLICELPEHTHTEACYQTVTVEEFTELICETPEHTHGDGCYTEETVCVCGLEEDETHTHTEDCYTVERVLTCTQEEHTHADTCYNKVDAHVEKVLTCTLQEHTHTEACYDAPPASEIPCYCGKSAHTHTAACYAADGTPICTMQQHTHTQQCYSNPSADIENEKTWSDSVAEVQLTGSYNQDVLLIANSQLGNGESTRNYKIDINGAVKGYTRYGAWYGDPYGDWCAMFCSFCLHYAGVDTAVFPQASNCQRWVESLTELALYHAAGDYTPKPGDLIFFDYDSYKSVKAREANHVGFVSELTENADGEIVGLVTIEGNTAGGVTRNTYTVSDDSIMGYGELVQTRTAKLANKGTTKAATSSTIECWQKVSTIDDANANYLIVSSGGYALGIDSSHAVTSTAAGLTELENYPGYYTSTIAGNFMWRFSATGTSSKQTNVLYNGYGLRLDDNTIINTTANQTTQTLTYSDPNWRLSYNDGTYTRNLVCSSDGTFSRSRSTTNANMQIYKLVEISVSTDPGGEIIVKPTYPEYLPVSDAKTGDTVVGTVEGTYYSDPATSQLESEFEGVHADDGRVISDKSVVYGDDDYDAFDTYAPNTFGVTLSTLGQKYAITEELQVSTPLDVVFVLDTSGSMINTTYNGVTSANIMIESLNKIMKVILDANEDNRVGVVCYSGAADKLLDLGRYTADNDKYFPEGECTSTTYSLSASNSIQRTDGTLYKGTFSRGWYGTFTQDGIAAGAQEFLDTTDVATTRTVEKETDEGLLRVTYTVTRRPLIILLSDGEPTYCTSDYNNVLATSNVYGNGNTGYTNNDTFITSAQQNNKGPLGYYTILSAKYYKDRIAEHYNTDAYFYTIGIGIDPTSDDSYEESVASDAYKRAVLNPTYENIEHLMELTHVECLEMATTSSYRDISNYIDNTSYMLYRLLHNTQTGSTVSLYYHSSQQYGIRTSKTLQNVPVLQNPYISSGYDYADGSFFSANNSVENLTTAFTNAISYTDVFPVYGFILKSNTPITVSDTIGDGMELKSEPILRYGGENYSPVSQQTVGNVTTYYYSGTYAATDGSGQVYDLSQVTATVTTDANGQQTVQLIVPDSQLPTYTPNLKNDGSAYFYFEELPARLIYQVGLTDEAVAEVQGLEMTGGTRTYYTNAWTQTDYSFSEFSPTNKNPYYKDNDYDKSPLPKTDNNSETKTNAWEFSADSGSTHVSEILGNNGRLTFEAEVFEVVPVSVQKVDEDGQPITSDTAEFSLYSDAALTNLVGTYETDETGCLTIPALRTNRTYYLVETKAPYGYAMLEEPLVFTIDADGNITGLDASQIYARVNDDGVLAVFNEEAKTTVSAHKVWSGVEIGEEDLPDITVQLYADGTPIRSAVVLNDSNEWYCEWTELPLLAADDKHEIAYTVQELDCPDGFVAFTAEDSVGVWTVTNRKIGVTSISVLKKWRGDSAETSVQVELLRNGATTGRYATLNADNNWYYRWDDLPDYDENGEIAYSVREIAVEGYTTEIHLWQGEDDPYGWEEVDTLAQSSAFVGGSRHLIVFNGTALAATEDGTALTAVAFDADTEITDNMLWEATADGDDFVLTNVGSGKILTLNGSHDLQLGEDADTKDTNWRYNSSNELYCTYVSTSYNRTRTYYFTGAFEDGCGVASSTESSSVAVTLYTGTRSIVYDDVEEGDRHYIIVNTKYEPPDAIYIDIRKVAQTDDPNETSTVLSGAEFALYRETGVLSDGQIPGTDGRIGTMLTSWTSSQVAHRITGLTDGTYYLVELQAPNGYKPLEAPVVFTVQSEEGVRTATIVYHPLIESGTDVTSMDIPNPRSDGYQLPETGGTGHIPLYLAGTLLVLTSLLGGYLLLRRKRKEEISSA